LIVQASAALINEAVQRSVDRVEPFEDIILETPVCGIHRTQGRVHAELVPDPCRAMLDVVLDGITHSDSVGFRPFFRLHMCTTTPFVVRQRVVLTAHRISAFPGPGIACANSTLLGVTEKDGDQESPLADIAEITFRKKKKEAEAEISAKSVQQTTDRLSMELAPSLYRASRSLSQGLDQLKRRGLKLQALEYSTAPEFIQSRVQVATHRRKGAKTAPEVSAGADLALRIHQSLVNEAGQALVGGKTYPLHELATRVDNFMSAYLREGREDALRRASLKALETLQKALGGKAATITFAKKDPVAVVFTESGFRIEITVAQLGLGGLPFAGGRVQAVYRLERTARGAMTVRQGAVRFLPPASSERSGKKLDPPPAPLRQFQEAMFGQVLKERIARADLTLPAPLSRVGLLAPRNAAIHDGWLVLDWKLKPKMKVKSGSGKPE
jgi:hypothetical protein